MMKQRICYLIMALVTGLFVYTEVFAKNIKDPLDRTAIMLQNPARSVLLDITRAGKRLVAVGERGIVILSDDAGRTWQQANVPTSVSLTGVAFPTPEQGWIIGHCGVVLHTKDAGNNWERQLDGVVAARLALDAAQIKAKEGKIKSDDHENKIIIRQLRDAQLLVKDGPDKPFLDIIFENNMKGFIIGAYGLMFRTVDGGKTWQSWMDHVDNPRGMNLYDIKLVGKIFYIVGEQGLVLKSTDGGNSFLQIKTPYEGSYFVTGVSSSGEIAVAGLRGNAYWSDDQGATLTRIKVPVPVSFNATLTLENGTLLFANQAGQLLASHDKGRTLQIMNTPRLPPIAAMESLGNDLLVTVGFGGVIPIPLNNTTPVVKSGENK